MSERNRFHPAVIFRIEACPHCGYCLQGLPENHRCPECGFKYDQRTIVLFNQFPWRIVLYIMFFAWFLTQSLFSYQVFTDPKFAASGQAWPTIVFVGMLSTGLFLIFIVFTYVYLKFFPEQERLRLVIGPDAVELLEKKASQQQIAWDKVNRVLLGKAEKGLWLLRVSSEGRYLTQRVGILFSGGPWEAAYVCRQIRRHVAQAQPGQSNLRIIYKIRCRKERINPRQAIADTMKK